MTMTLVSTVTVGAGGAASIEFTGIPASATDLIVYLSARTTADEVGSTGRLRINSDSGSNYTALRLATGEGGGPYSDSITSNYLFRLPKYAGSTHTSNTFSSSQFYFANYAGSTSKSISAETAVEINDATLFNLTIGAGLWANSSAITSLAFSANSGGNFVQHTTASLYTITKGSGGATVS